MSLTNDQQIETLRRMLLIRNFEETAIRLYGEGHYRGSTHPYIGQEATALGVCAALDADDQILATYRGHGAAIAKGADPKRLMAELLGKATGVSKGKGGSMHFSHRMMSALSAATRLWRGIFRLRAGWRSRIKLDKTGRVIAVFFGDGASCEGVFYETLNMATLWKLPLLFICENNEYAISTHYTESISVPFIAQRAAGFGLPGVTIDGRDFYAVYDDDQCRRRNGRGRAKDRR